VFLLYKYELVFLRYHLVYCCILYF